MSFAGVGKLRNYRLGLSEVLVHFSHKWNASLAIKNIANIGCMGLQLLRRSQFMPIHHFQQIIGPYNQPFQVVNRNNPDVDGLEAIH